MLSSLTLTNFRNHAARTLQFVQPTTVVLGPNAQGKTSIVEAVSLLSTGESFRADRVEEMVRFNQELARVQGVVIDQPTRATEIAAALGDTDSAEIDDDPRTLEVIVTRGEVQGKKTQYRLFSVNQVRKRRKDFLGNLTTVVFRPEDMRLIEGSPARRRNFMDTPLTVMSAEYAESLHTYEQALVRRNKLLQQVREGFQPRTILTYWNLAIVKHGEILQKHRRDFLGIVNVTQFPLQFSVEYQPSIISELRLEEYLDREIASGHTLIGPHKDDFSVQLPESQLRITELSAAENPTQILTQSDGTPLVSVETYGSRGQQRLGVLWLKIGEYEFLRSQRQQPPLLLLDDIFSELDTQSRDKVFSLLGEGQSIVTTTEPHLVEELKNRTQAVAVINLAEQPV